MSVYPTPSPDPDRPVNAVDAVDAVSPVESVQEVMNQARRQAADWSSQPLAFRQQMLRNWRSVIARNLDEWVDALRADTSKTHMDALMSDMYPTLDAISYYVRGAQAMLAPSPRPVPLLFWGTRGYVVRQPLGVVAVFAPWNFPVQLALVPVITALLAGNCVILKPSEQLRLLPDLIRRSLAEAGLPPFVCQVLEGGPDVGAALVEARPDKVFFTGSLNVGRKVMEHAARHLIPCDLELSGKDAMIVCADAHLERAAKAAVWGGFFNAGQVCVSVERVYVHQSVFDDFVRLVKREVQTLRHDSEGFGDIGSMTTRAGFTNCRRLLADAVDQGAQVVCGDLPAETSDLFFPPTILTHISPDMLIMQEEIFGPLLPILPFSTEQEAIDLANDSSFGLGASVFSKDVRRANELALKLKTGTCYVNDVVRNLANMQLPFGGMKASGIGRYHGPEGLHAFTQTQAVMIDRGRRKTMPHYFPYKRRTYELLKRLMRLLYR
ncbi:MAG: aldehyde dehydrogenase family protein [Firmicutes bacterium]|nr:aldehyde dehydrogenase family protein [Bacillota bacterium]